MRRLDGPLSRRARQVFGDPTCCVYVGTSSGRRDPARPAAGQPRDRGGEYVLERERHEPLVLGRSGAIAYRCLLRAARRTREDA